MLGIFIAIFATLFSANSPTQPGTTTAEDQSRLTRLSRLLVLTRSSAAATAWQTTKERTGGAASNIGKNGDLWGRTSNNYGRTMVYNL